MIKKLLFIAFVLFSMKLTAAAGFLLHEAAGNGDCDAVIQLLAAGAEVNKKEIFNHETPLHVAARYGRSEVANILIDKGADIHALDRHGETPLHWAARFDYGEVVSTLIKKGAHVNARDACDWTPLHMAAKNGLSKIARILIYNGADIDAKNREEKTPLDIASKELRVKLKEYSDGEKGMEIKEPVCEETA